MTTVGVTDLSLIDILMAQRHLFPDIRWTTFRYNYLRSTEQYDDRDYLFSGDDYTPDVMTSEVNTALQVLDSQHLKEFLSSTTQKEHTVARTALKGAISRTMSASSFS